MINNSLAEKNDFLYIKSRTLLVQFQTLPERGGKVDRLWKSGGVSVNITMKTLSKK